MAQVLAFIPPTPKKSNNFNMKSLLKNSKKVFIKYNVNKQEKKSYVKTSINNLQQGCLSEEEHQNWLNEKLESKQLLMY
ncbi:hypothetical protein FF38_11165 [Lucilia cuprina]|uniref:Uncharacterized protein n=1 Tax=Lucilia cuprina TaxID=7375 RepID=A0A0L0BVT7_LUCCU|nr:hypothetical protein FF38_11165 [Lucilia cuprina]